MAFVLNEEQLMIQTMARKFSRDVLLPTASERDKTCEFPLENLKQMAELGFMGMMVPEEYGGAGVDAVSYAVALTEVAYGCASTAVVMSVHNSICCEAIVKFGNENQKETWLPQMCACDCIGAFALTEPEAGSDPVSQKTTAKLDGDEWVLNGTKQFITSASHAGVIIATAVTDKAKRHRGISAFLIPQDCPGLIIGPHEDKMGLRASDTVQIVLDECRIPKENLLGKEGEGFRIAMVCLDSGRIGISAQSVGVAQACLDEAIAYTNERKQFGQPVSDFQGVRWYIAEMATQIEAARLMCFNAATLKSQDKRHTTEASMAKMFASEMVNQVASKALQLHGGYGYCKEYPIERHYRDARVFSIYEGTNEIQRIVISNRLLGPTSKK